MDFAASPWAQEFIRVPPFKEDMHALLSSIPVMGMLSAGELNVLVSVMMVRNYGRNEVVERQGGH
ncbi:MAG: hypothetical protein RDV48_21910 [Candidatus Eremiobacteraeota bacterium]|nr:hypothetical protein [Candidatus Eremiobacteraeota bacterium]